MIRHPASFRDPAGFVFDADVRGVRLQPDRDVIRRAVTEYGLPHYQEVRATGLIDRLIADGALLPETRVGTSLDGHPDVRLVLEHPRLPLVSYPYEWPFAALKAAALLHLDIQVQALDAGVVLTDATAYNVQFIGARPVFIDHLAFRPYRDGELWAAHRQFCEQFLHPLLLQSELGIEFQPWYRGRLEGIPGDALVRLLHLRHKCQFNVALHVVLPARLQGMAGRPSTDARLQKGRLSRAALRELFLTFRRWIARLEPKGVDRTTWAGYDAAIPDEETAAITSAVQQFVRETGARRVWDLGCNAGKYCEAALSAGADYVVGLDSDVGALEGAFARARDRHLRLTPLCIDLANPTPAQGWLSAERESLLSRGPADALLALAVVHHIAIARNVPLEEVVTFLLRVAPQGMVGFVPPTDRRASALFKGREEIFKGYTLARFVEVLGARARVVRQQPLPGSDRVLLTYSAR